jgi:hypothetical protein
MPNGSFFGAAGGENEPDDVDIYNISSQGDLLWKTRLGGLGGQNIYSLSSLGNSAIVLGGTSSSSGSKDILWLRIPLEKQIEGCDIKESDAIATMVSVNEASFSFSQITNGNLANWVAINPAIESDGFLLTYTCGNLCNSEDPLPLKIISFSGNKLENNQIRLYVETVNESKVESLTIEYSVNASSFIPLDALASKGGIHNQYYYATDKLSSKTGNLYFRIKIQDKDGTVYYSNILTIKNSTFSNGFKVFPNPSTGVFNISFSGLKNGVGKVRILDNLGRLKYSKEYSILKGENAIISGSNLILTSGVYYVLMDFDGKLYSEKIFIKSLNH